MLWSFLRQNVCLICSVQSCCNHASYVFMSSGYHRTSSGIVKGHSTPWLLCFHTAMCKHVDWSKSHAWKKKKHIAEQSQGVSNGWKLVKAWPLPYSSHSSVPKFKQHTGRLFPYPLAITVKIPRLVSHPPPSTSRGTHPGFFAEV